MATGGRGAFRTETRTTRLERLHGPKRRMLSPEEKEKLRQEALEEQDRFQRGPTFGCFRDEKRTPGSLGPDP